MGGTNESQGTTPPPLSKACLWTLTSLHAFAVALTLFRLWIRRGRYWWEDGLAMLAGVFSILFGVSTWLMFLPLAPTVGRTFQWVGTAAFGNSVWLARISILISIMRVSTSPRFSLLIHANLVLFVLLWAVEFASKMWLCGSNSAYVCATTRLYEDVIISLDVASTFILVALPLVMLWDVKLARMPKMLILVVFGVGVVNAAASYVHALFLVPQTPLTWMTGNIQCAVDVTVCNLLVTVTFVYRVLRTRKRRKTRGTYGTSDADDSAAPAGHVSGFESATRYTNNVVEGRFMLTTVDLDSANFEREHGFELEHGRSSTV